MKADDVFQRIDVPGLTWIDKQEFGHLRPSRYAQDMVICKCGREVWTPIETLRKQATLVRATSPSKHPLTHYLSCGCLNPNNDTHPQSKETGIAHYIGQKFGRLTALYPIGDVGDPRVVGGDETNPNQYQDHPDIANSPHRTALIRAAKYNVSGKALKARSKLWQFQCDCRVWGEGETMAAEGLKAAEVANHTIDPHSNWINFNPDATVRKTGADGHEQKSLIFQLGIIANQNYANMLVPSCGCWILDLPKLRDARVRHMENADMRMWRERVQGHINKK